MSLKPKITMEKKPDASTPSQKKAEVSQAIEPVEDSRLLPEPPKFDKKPCFWQTKLQAYWRQILYSGLGVVIALLIIYWGFWRTLLLVLLGGLGFFLAERQEGRCPLRSWSQRLKKYRPFVK